MKFETILDATILAGMATNLYWFGDSSKEYNLRKGRQCAAFRARLVKMYREIEADYYNLLETPAVINDPLLGMEEQDG